MTTSVIAPASQVFAFVLGCALIHVARAHSAVVTHLLTHIAIGIVILLLISAAGIPMSDDRSHFNDITAYAAIAGQP